MVLSCFLRLSAQDYYWVEFTDKNQNTYSIDKPQEFLSENALNRRLFFDIPITQSDLPVSYNYKHELINLEAKILKSSKWLNGVFVETENNNFLQEVEVLPFVKSSIKIEYKSHKLTFQKLEVEQKDITTEIAEFRYGYAFDNINTINGKDIHDDGFLGNTIDIAVMDNGFKNVNINSYFDTLRTLGKLHGAYNFVDNTPNVFSSGEHGAFVMSTLAAFKEDTLVGTAPLGNYYLFTTEDENAEGLPEEMNWAMAAEWADSALGTWVVLTTSLGYTNGFNDSNTNHTYADMDGNTTIITRAADLAAQKGMLVVNSAGNEGLYPWYYIGAPADGDSVLAIGAITKDIEIATFSSYGPSSDGRVKPNVCALGQGVIAVNPIGELKSISGTSFSCPITAGMAACLWEAFPQKSNMDIFNAIQQSAHLYYTPEKQYGYGIPNFGAAYQILQSNVSSEEKIAIYPNPAKEELNIIFVDDYEGSYTIKIANLSGALVYKESDYTKTYTSQIDVKFLPQGVYFISVQQGKKVYKSKFIKE